MNYLLRNFLQIHRKPVGAKSHQISNRRPSIAVSWDRFEEIAQVTFAIGYQT